MDRRATFNSTWLAAALIAPQLFLVFIFFFPFWVFVMRFFFGEVAALAEAAHSEAALASR